MFVYDLLLRSEQKTARLKEENLTQITFSLSHLNKLLPTCNPILIMSQYTYMKFTSIGPRTLGLALGSLVGRQELT